MRTLDEINYIMHAARRAAKLAAKHGIAYATLDAAMDIEAAHADCPMDLKQLCEFDDSNFGHDVFGIRRYIDRETKSLAHCFVPRCALPKV